MNAHDRIFVAGHRGLVGAGIVRKLKERGCTDIITRSHAELDLTRQAETESFFLQHKPDYVFLSAAKVGGIGANSTYPADFIYQNLAIACNVIHAAYLSGVKKLINLGSSCIYPRHAPQPMQEKHLLTGSLEPTNEPYAVAKIAAIKLCRYYNQQHGTDFISLMPSNLYGPHDNFDLESSHVLPAMLRKFHLSKLVLENREDELRRESAVFGPVPSELIGHIRTRRRVPLWGTGASYREFLHVDDLADACLYCMETGRASDIGEIANIGTGRDLTIRETADIVRRIVATDAGIDWDASKPDGTPRKLLDIGRITSLGWKPRIDLETGLASYYAWYKQRIDDA